MGFWLMIAGPMIMIGGLTAGVGLAALAVGVKPWMNMPFDKMVLLGTSLDKMTDGFTSLGRGLMSAGPGILLGASLVTPGMLILLDGIKPWMAMDMEAVIALPQQLIIFAAWLLPAGILLAMAGVPFFWGALLVSMGMTILWMPMILFSFAMAAMLPYIPHLVPLGIGLAVLAFGLMAFGLAIFFFGLAILNPFVFWGMWTLVGALTGIGLAFGTIDTGTMEAFMSVLNKLTQIMLAGYGVYGGLSTLAWGIREIAYAMDELPTLKMIVFSMATDSAMELGEVAGKITPQAAVSAKALVDEAERYVQVQNDMSAPWMDPFMRIFEASAQADVAKANASKAKAEAGGQDVVLVLNERELGRAVETILNKKMNLSIS